MNTNINTSTLLKTTTPINHSLWLKLLIIAIVAVISVMGWLSFWIFTKNVTLSDFLIQSLSADSQMYWQWSRVLGVVAYLLFWLSVMTGLMIGSKNANTWFSRGTALSWHQFFSSFAIIVALMHAGILYFDGYLNPTVWQLLIPFTMTSLDVSKMVLVGVGQAGLYLAVIIVLGNQAKRFLSQKTWRYIHILALLAYIAFVVHGLYVGTDSQEIWLQWLYFFTNAILGVVIIYRIIQLKATNS